LNLDYLRERFAILAKEDPSKFFIKGVPSMPMAEQEMAMKVAPGSTGKRSGSDVGSQLAEGIQKPSLKEMVGASK